MGATAVRTSASKMCSILISDEKAFSARKCSFVPPALSRGFPRGVLVKPSFLELHEFRIRLGLPHFHVSLDVNRGLVTRRVRREVKRAPSGRPTHRPGSVSSRLSDFVVNERPGMKDLLFSACAP